MITEQHTYSKKVIEIADFMYKYPDKKMSDVLSYFVVRCRKNKRTIERYVREAKEYNINRIHRQEKIRDEELTAETKKSLKSDILTRNESLKVLSDIANGNISELRGETLVTYNSDRIRAIQQLSKMQGWEIEKIDVTTKGDAIASAMIFEKCDIPIEVVKMMLVEKSKRIRNNT